MELRALWAPYFTLLDIQNALSEPRVKLQPRLFFFLLSLKFLNLSKGLPQGRSLPKIAARGPYRLPIKSLTANYNIKFCVSLNFLFCAGSPKMHLNMSELGLKINKFISNLFWVSSYKELVQLSAHVFWKKM